jgi:hypothetical protein
MNSFDAHATHRLIQSALDRKFPKYGEYATLKEFAESDSFKATTLIFDNAQKIAEELRWKQIPAADLSDEQKCALYTLAGLMKYEV